MSVEAYGVICALTGAIGAFGSLAARSLGVEGPAVQVVAGVLTVVVVVVLGGRVRA